MSSNCSLAKSRSTMPSGNRVESQVPRRVPGVFPLVRHRDDVFVHHVEPLAVPEFATATVEGVRMVLLQPAVTVEEEELLAPQHPGDRLTHHLCRIRGHRRRGHRAIEVVRLLKPDSQDLVKLRAKARCDGLLSPLSAASAWAVRRSCTVADWRGPTLSR